MPTASGARCGAAPPGLPRLLTRCKTFYIDGQPITPTANHVHKELVLLKFPGVDDMNAALTYKNKDLFLRRADIVLPEGEYFDDELLGLEVYDCDTGAPAGNSDGGGRVPRQQGLHRQG